MAFTQLLTFLLLLAMNRMQFATEIPPEVPAEKAFEPKLPPQAKKSTPEPPSCPWSCESTSPAASCGRTWTPVKKITGGMKVQRYAWPWMGALWSNGTLLCGATLICDAWVLTAAHCFLDSKGTGFDFSRTTNLYLGRYLRKGYHRTVRKIAVNEDMVTIHWQYSAKTRANDIALIRLPKPIKRTAKIRPICLPEFGRSAPKPGKRCRVAGWGATMGFGPSNYRLKEAAIPIVSTDICKFSYFFSQTEKVICAGGEAGEDTCTGDSGGPMICEAEGTPGQWQVQGVISFGAKTCATEDKPAIYTQVAYYLFWIYDVIDSECEKWKRRREAETYANRV